MNPPELARYQRYLLYALVLLLPFVITPTGKDVFRQGKETFAQILILAIVMLSAAQAVLERRTRLQARVVFPLAALCAWASASLAWAAVPPVALYALFNLILFSLFALALARLLTPEDAQFVFWLNLIPAAMTGFYTWVQYQGADPVFITPQGASLYGRENAGGLVGDVNTAGCYLAISLLLATNSLLVERSTAKRVVAAAGGVAVFAGLICTQTLTAIGALLAGGLVLAVADAYLSFSSGRGARRFWIGAIALVLAAAAGTALFVARNESFRGRLASRYESFQARDWQSLTSYRAGIFSVTWQMARERPWTGHGLHSFGTEFFDAKVRHLPGTRITMPLSIESTPRQAHNEFLQVWAELGMVGLALVLGLIAASAYGAIAALRRLRGTSAAYAAAAALSGCVAAWVAALGFFPAQLSLTAVWIAIPTGCLASLAALAATGAGHPAKNGRFVRGAADKGEATAPWPLVACGLGGWLLASYALLWPLVANQKTGEATALVERVMQSQEPNARIFLERSVLLLGQARLSHPIDPQIYQGAGTAHWFLSQFDEALANFARAALLDPSPEAFTNLGETYRAVGRSSEAAACYELALKYDPEFEKAKSALRLVRQ